MSSRRDCVWSIEDETKFLKSAPPHLRMAYLLAVKTAQRKGDLLRLPWSAYDGKFLRLQQSKTGKRVTIPVEVSLRIVLDEAKAAREPVDPTDTILITERGQPWTSGGFDSSWRAAVAAAGIVGLTFHDLRGTAVTRMALAECSIPEIAAITGHSLSDVNSILDRSYLKREEGLALSAIRKLEANEQNPN